MTNKASRVTERLQHIREAIQNAKNDLGGLTKDQFLADGKTQRAVIESITVIGESANSIMHLAPRLEQQSPDLWQHFQDVYDMRIILTHGYFRVDLSVVWDTIKNDLPKLEALLGGVDIRNGDDDGGS